MDIVTLRRKNLRTAIDAAISNSPRLKSDVDFCEFYELNPSHISQLVRGHGSFGERAARNLEKKIGWEDGFLDKEIPVDEIKQKATEIGNVTYNNKRLIKIPVLDYVQAGLFHDVAYDGINPKSYTYSTYDGCSPESVFSLIVEGLSMTPDFMPGDELIIDGSLVPKPGCLVIAKNNDHETTFKKYRVTGYDEFCREEFELVPLNPDFPIISSKTHDILIIGVVIKQVKDYKY